MSTRSNTEEENLSLNVCINCTNPVNVSVKIPSNKSIKCERCGEIVDRYIEFESCMVFLDCVLLSEIVFTHIIYNSRFKVIFCFNLKCFYSKTVIFRFTTRSQSLLFSSSHLQFGNTNFQVAIHLRKKTSSTKRSFIYVFCKC